MTVGELITLLIDYTENGGDENQKIEYAINVMGDDNGDGRRTDINSITTIERVEPNGRKSRTACLFANGVM